MRQAYDYWQNQPGNYLKPLHQSARADPPKGASLPSKKTPKHPKITALLGLRALTAQMTDSIAPTEFPKNWSAASHTRRLRRSISATYSPREEKVYTSSRICTRKLGKTVPKDLVFRWQGQQSTDPKSCPPKKMMGLRFPAVTASNSTRRCQAS